MDLKMPNSTYEAFMATREKIVNETSFEDTYNEYAHERMMLENKAFGMHQEYVDSYKEMMAASRHDRNLERSRKSVVDGRSYPEYSFTQVQIMMFDNGILR